MAWSKERSVFSSAFDGLLKFSTTLLPFGAFLAKLPMGENAGEAVYLSLLISCSGLLYYYGKTYEENAKNKSVFLMIECMVASASLILSIVVCVIMISSPGRLESRVALFLACMFYVWSITPIMIEMFITFHIKDKKKEEKTAELAPNNEKEHSR